MWIGRITEPYISFEPESKSLVFYMEGDKDLKSRGIVYYKEGSKIEHVDDALHYVNFIYIHLWKQSMISIMQYMVP